MERLKNEHYTHEINLPANLIYIEELSEKTGVSTARLQEMVDCHYIPHWKIDGTTPMFQIAETKKMDCKEYGDKGGRVRITN